MNTWIDKLEKRVKRRMMIKRIKKAIAWVILLSLFLWCLWALFVPRFGLLVTAAGCVIGVAFIWSLKTLSE